MEIRSIKIDFEESVLKINGKQIVDRPVLSNTSGSRWMAIDKTF